MKHKKTFILLGMILHGFSIVNAQNNSFPVTGNPWIYDYSPGIVLKRNTSEGGFTQGIQTKLADGTDNWYFGALHDQHFVVSKGDYLGIKFLVDKSGNVGIGTLAPTEKLSVKGKIRAQEVKVEASNWPDYVFEEGYKAETLKELESYIKENKHLPEIPSAKEMEENGIELGEMNKLLLKKIEELTLHLIEKDKEITALKQMEQRLAALERTITKKK
ncbi:hypothetical protein [Pedobacter chinensis]|uniref:hypothetical protein n=1 Tax=Pedobacter chinensis TaxID=2282421 RepID=UPI0018F5E568|nr:hypothetical protein [Pedobacter chinensis]